MELTVLRCGAGLRRLKSLSERYSLQGALQLIERVGSFEGDGDRFTRKQIEVIVGHLNVQISQRKIYVPRQCRCPQGEAESSISLAEAAFDFGCERQFQVMRYVQEY